MTHHYFSYPIELNLNEGLLECEASFSIKLFLGARSRHGYRPVNDSEYAVLLDFPLGNRRLPRSFLVSILSEEEVNKLEQSATDHITSTYSADEADDYADYCYEQKRDRDIA